MFTDLTIKDFLKRTAGSEPVPGGGSVSALHGAIAASLATMVANLTIGKKRYADCEEEMKQIAQCAEEMQKEFETLMDADSEAYAMVFAAYKLPKSTEMEILARQQAIESAARKAIETPLKTATLALELMRIIVSVARKGNKNAITDACVAMQTAFSALYGAVLNVRINLSDVSDKDYIEEMWLCTENLVHEGEALNSELQSGAKQHIQH